MKGRTAIEGPIGKRPLDVKRGRVNASMGRVRRRYSRDERITTTRHRPYNAPVFISQSMADIGDALVSESSVTIASSQTASTHLVLVDKAAGIFDEKPKNRKGTRAQLDMRTRGGTQLRAREVDLKAQYSAGRPVTVSRSSSRNLRSGLIFTHFQNTPYIFQNDVRD